MIDAPSSTWFTTSLHWNWLIVAYFFLGALAGGTYFLSTLIDFMRGGRDRRIARLGYYITVPLLLVVGVVLIVDLGRPARFWHLMIENHTLTPLFKYWVPMSTGAWAVPLFSFCAFLSFLAAFAEHRQPGWHFVRRLRPPGIVGALVAVPGALLALYVTGYTGVMISVLNRPVWSDTPFFGMLFLISAVTMSSALLVLGARALRWQSPVVDALQRICFWLLAVQVLVFIALFISLGEAIQGLLNIWGAVLALGFVVGIVLPLVLARARRGPMRGGLPVAAALVLAGGFIMRMAIVFVPNVVAP